MAVKRVPIAGKDYELRLPKPHLSPSQITTWMNCSWAYYRGYVLGNKTKPTPEMVEGTCIDKAISSLLLDDNPFGALTDEIIRAERKGLLTRAQGFRVQKNGDLFLDDLQKRLGRPPWEDWNPEPGNVQTRTERLIAGIPVLGFADAVRPWTDSADGSTTASEVIDFKVVNSPRGDWYNPAKSIQLAYYCWGLGIPTGTFCLFDRNQGGVVIRRHEFDLKKTEAWLKFTVSNIARQISAGAYAPCSPTSGLCCERWCGHWDQCMGKYF